MSYKRCYDPLAFADKSYRSTRLSENHQYIGSVKCLRGYWVLDRNKGQGKIYIFWTDRIFYKNTPSSTRNLIQLERVCITCENRSIPTFSWIPISFPIRNMYHGEPASPHQVTSCILSAVHLWNKTIHASSYLSNKAFPISLDHFLFKKMHAQCSTTMEKKDLYLFIKRKASWPSMSAMNCLEIIFIKVDQILVIY